MWFDEWEILPGDSLVDKVFEEGLKSADAMVIVLSSNSIDKPWVREESLIEPNVVVDVPVFHRGRL